MPTAEAAPEASRGQRAAKKLSEESELDAEPEPEPELEPQPELEQGTIAGLLRHGPGWAVPRSADKCRSKLQAARLQRPHRHPSRKKVNEERRLATTSRVGFPSLANHQSLQLV